ncbi:hypothetical protein FNV43_RR03919 [Rhamnella rubrinervis]|uniref:tRNA-uridine aminocarboxypropyltransferase n=1 Tax=Rhamnella rubrinervis TaxID=2594499 RepID=A0A8K0HKU1_9ROSA|nr:hypothetical protein FNV43_RR03919 [Rhamnella rubrinervis]
MVVTWASLKNLIVATVYDVNLEARFVIRSLDQKSEMGSFGNSSSGVDFDQHVRKREIQRSKFDLCNEERSRGNVGTSEYELFANCPKEKNNDFVDGECNLGGDGSCSESTQNDLKDLNFAKKFGSSRSEASVLESGYELTVDEGTGTGGLSAFETPHKPVVRQSNGDKISDAIKLNAVSDMKEISKLDINPTDGTQRDNKGPVLTATIVKHGVVSSLSHNWMRQSHWDKPTFEKIFDTPEAREALTKGFIVKKVQKRQQEGCLELEEDIEFEIEVPPGSALLYPSEEAVGVKGLEAINFEVKNLIVLDGTWSKAKRIYVENPWLKLLPHLKLELDKVSLYNGVRLQPKAGCLSTIESIVYALKAVGNNLEGLDNLLDVFGSMVGDQKRCKEERLSNSAQI